MENGTAAKVVSFGPMKGKTVEQAMSEELKRVDEQPTALRQKMRDDARQYIQSLESRRAEMIARYNLVVSTAQEFHNEQSTTILSNIDKMQAQIERIQEQIDSLTGSLKTEQARHAERMDAIEQSHSKDLNDIDHLISVQETAMANLAKPVN